MDLGNLFTRFIRSNFQTEIRSMLEFDDKIGGVAGIVCKARFVDVFSFVLDVTLDWNERLFLFFLFDKG